MALFQSRCGQRGRDGSPGQRRVHHQVGKGPCRLFFLRITGFFQEIVACALKINELSGSTIFSLTSFPILCQVQGQARISLRVGVTGPPISACSPVLCLQPVTLARPGHFLGLRHPPPPLLTAGR